MDDNLNDRMAQTRKRGRPPKHGVGAQLDRPIDDQPQPVHRVEIPIVGIRCPGCGRSMVPRRDRVQDGKAYAHCTLCGVRLLMSLDDLGRPAFVRRV